MQLPLTDEATALISAAVRHVRDAEYLASAPEPHRSLDQAFHLAGYGPECARKATLSFRWLDKAIGHRFDATAEGALDFALGLDPAAQRYSPNNWGTRYPSLTNWNEQSRYDRTGTHLEPQVLQLLAEARAAVDDIVLALWADGRLPDGSASW